MRTITQLVEAARRWPADEPFPISLRELRLIQGYLFPSSKGKSVDQLKFHGHKLELL